MLSCNIILILRILISFSFYQNAINVVIKLLEVQDKFKVEVISSFLPSFWRRDSLRLPVFFSGCWHFFPSGLFPPRRWYFQ